MNSDTILKIDKALKIAILLALLVLLICIRVYKLDSCDLLDEQLGGATQGEVVGIYYDKCLEDYKTKTLPITSGMVWNFDDTNVSG